MLGVNQKKNEPVRTSQGRFQPRPIENQKRTNNRESSNSKVGSSRLATEDNKINKISGISQTRVKTQSKE